MITKITKEGDNAYILNNAVKISDITFEGADLVYDIDYQDDKVTEEEAIKICEQFLRDALNDMVGKMRREAKATAAANQTAEL